MPLSLGISSYFHDSAVAIVRNGEILGAVQEERFSRIKGDSSFPTLSIYKLLATTGVTLDEITNVGYYEIPHHKLNRITTTLGENFPKSFWNALKFMRDFRQNSLFPEKDIKKVFNRDIEVLYFPHHMSHAASAYFPSTFSEAAILTVDGVGEWATTGIHLGRENQLTSVKEIHFPDSVGLLYATFTSFCGFKVNSGEYKLMGLAPYGRPKYQKAIEENIVELFEDGSIKLNMKYFGFLDRMKMYNEKKFEELFQGKARVPESDITQRECDIASSIQKVIEKIIVRQARYALEVTGSKNLCMAGGVALNCVANAKILEYIEPSNIFIQPAAGDAGGALGAAFMANLDSRAEKKRISSFGSFLGTEISSSDLNSTIEAFQLEAMEYESEIELSRRVSELLASGEVIGWVKGRMEFGPRALGARSILADARNPQMQKILNLKIKKRESFRPFAPVVLLDKVHDWFEWPKATETPYMLFTAPVKEELRETHFNGTENFHNLNEWISEKRSKIPATTHLDFSARIQTVDVGNPLYELLTEFYALTGCPVLVNTSFNVRNEPIVESAEDAIRCFLTTDMDSLVIGSFLIEKTKQSVKDKDYSYLVYKGVSD
jgi:carbamoyltransferase